MVKISTSLSKSHLLEKKLQSYKLQASAKSKENSSISLVGFRANPKDITLNAIGTISKQTNGTNSNLVILREIITQVATSITLFTFSAAKILKEKRLIVSRDCRSVL